MNGEKAATPSWVVWLLGLVQALVFAAFGLIFNEIRHIQAMREKDMAEIRATAYEMALWRGTIDSKVNGIRDDIAEVREAVIRREGNTK